MERKRVNGRFAREGEDAASDGAAETKPRRKSRTRHAKLIGQAREQLVESIPAIAATLVMEARLGSVSHMKLLLHLLGIDHGGLGAPENRPVEKTLEEILMEQWAKEP